MAKAHKCETVAFPLISSSIFGYPRDQAFRVAADTIGELLMENNMMFSIIIFDRAACQISSKLFADIAEYIDDHYVDVYVDFRRTHSHRLSRSIPCEDAMLCEEAVSDLMDISYTSILREAAPDNLSTMLDDLDAGFSETLPKLINSSGKKDPEIYKKANVDRKLFSKIRNDPDYKPSKTTAIAFAIALELDLEETKDFITRAEFALSHSSKFDVIIEILSSKKNYDVFAINEALFAFGQSLLGA